MRTVIEKYKRVAAIQNQYAEKIIALAERQLSIDQKLIREFGLDDNRTYEYRDILSYDFLRMSTDGDGIVELWESGRCGDSDSCLSSINVDQLIVAGNFEGYEQRMRAILKAKAESMLGARQKEAQRKREQLQNELVRINTELNKLGEQP